MGRVLNLMAFVVFATSLFMRSVDPVIPQIAAGLNVEPTTAALLSTGFTLPYALVQPILGALADMFSKTRLIAICMLILGIATLACGLATNFETLMGLRVLAGITAGVIGDLIGWRGVFFATGAIDLIALAFAIPGFRGMNEAAGRFDLSTLVPNYRAVLL